MKCLISHFAFAVCAALASLNLAGCSDTPDSINNSPNAAAPSKPSPEESFELIVATFERGVEDIPIGFVVRSEGGHSMMSGRNEVTHELVRPAKEGDSYRGVITVDSAWKYSVQQSTEDPRESEPNEDSGNAGSSLDEPADAGSIEILDSDLIASSGSGNESRPAPTGVAEKKVVRRPDEEAVRNYELLYKNGRWELVTKLDPETEQSIENAFKKALRTQI
jgi:hypothetical protein